MIKQQRRAPKSHLFLYLFVIVALSAALWYGRSRAAPAVLPHIHSIFPEASSVEQLNGLYTALAEDQTLLGWAATGTAPGFGGPLLVTVGVAPSGDLAGASVLEHKETPMFFHLVRAPDYFASLEGRSFDSLDYRYDGVTGATLSGKALAASVKDGVSHIASDKFDVQLPATEQPFEFGLLELVIIALLAAGVKAQYLGRSVREILRWATQVSGLLIIGFWENSPITLAKITTLLSGYFPDLRSNLALYLLIAGFVLTLLLLGKDIYCLHLCPFGAAQRFINLIGGKKLALPLWSVRLMNRSRNVIVFVAILLALATAQPVRASYEPFAALFALRGTTLQWVLLFIILTVSLIVRRPWCHFFCPMRSCERVLLDLRQKGLSLRQKR